MSPTAFRRSLLAGFLAVSEMILAGEASVQNTVGHTVSSQAGVPSPPTVIYAKDNVPATPKVEDLRLKESVSQYGITWIFEKPARVGKFIGGDWYVVGPVTIKSIDPRPLFGDEVKTAPVEEPSIHESHYKGQYARNGSTLNMPAVVPPTKSPRGRAARASIAACPWTLTTAIR